MIAFSSFCYEENEARFRAWLDINETSVALLIALPPTQKQKTSIRLAYPIHLIVISILREA